MVSLGSTRLGVLGPTRARENFRVRLAFSPRVGHPLRCLTTTVDEWTLGSPILDEQTEAQRGAVTWRGPALEPVLGLVPPRFWDGTGDSEKAKSRAEETGLPLGNASV